MNINALINTIAAKLEQPAIIPVERSMAALAGCKLTVRTDCENVYLLENDPWDHLEGFLGYVEISHHTAENGQMSSVFELYSDGYWVRSA